MPDALLTDDGWPDDPLALENSRLRRALEEARLYVAELANRRAKQLNELCVTLPNAPRPEYAVIAAVESLRRIDAALTDLQEPAPDITPTVIVVS